jgi:hypothetical protein
MKTVIQLKIKIKSLLVMNRKLLKYFRQKRIHIFLYLLSIPNIKLYEIHFNPVLILYSTSTVKLTR